MNSTGWDYRQVPRPPFAGVNANPSEFNGSRTRLIRPILNLLNSEAKIVCVAISGKRGMGKSALADFISFIHSEHRFPVWIGDSRLHDPDNQNAVICQAYHFLGGQDEPTWERVQNLLPIEDGIQGIVVFRLRLFQPQLVCGNLSVALCQIARIFENSTNKKALMVLEGDELEPFSVVYQKQGGGEWYDLHWEYVEHPNSCLKISKLKNGRKKVHAKPSYEHIMSIPLVNVNVGSLTPQDVRDFVTGKEGKIVRVSSTAWESQSYGRNRRCKRGNYENILYWAGTHPAAVCVAERRCVDCLNGSLSCDKDELHQKISEPIILAVRESVKQELDSNPHKTTLQPWGFLNPKSQVAGVVADIYYDEFIRRRILLYKFVFRIRNLFRIGIFHLIPPIGKDTMLHELRDLLASLDDPEIDQLCLLHFPSVYDKFSRGMRRDEKINVLLDHCRRYPEEGERLRGILHKRRPPDAEVSVSPSPKTPGSGGGNSVSVVGRENIVENGNIFIVFQGGALTVPKIPNGGVMMDEILALTAGLQFAYWLWNATVQPGMTRFSDTIGTALGEIGSERLKRWFGAAAPQDTQNRVDESRPAQQQRLDIAKVNIENDPEWDAARFMDTTKRVLVALLRDPTKYSMDQLQIFWQDFGDPGIAFNLLVAQCALVGNVPACIADRLVMETIRNGKLPQLIAAMRKP